MGKLMFHSHRYVTIEWVGLILPTPTAPIAEPNVARLSTYAKSLVVCCWVALGICGRTDIMYEHTLTMFCAPWMLQPQQ